MTITYSWHLFNTYLSAVLVFVSQSPSIVSQSVIFGCSYGVNGDLSGFLVSLSLTYELYLLFVFVFCFLFWYTCFCLPSGLPQTLQFSSLPRCAEDFNLAATL